MRGQKTITEQKSNQEQQINQQIFHSFLRKHINYNQKITGEDANKLSHFFAKRYGLKEIKFEKGNYKLGEVVETIDSVNEGALSKAFVKISKIPNRKNIYIKKTNNNLGIVVEKKSVEIDEQTKKEKIVYEPLKDDESNEIVKDTLNNYAKRYVEKINGIEKIKKKNIEKMFVEALNPGAGIRIEYYRNSFAKFLSKMIPKRKKSLVEGKEGIDYYPSAEFKGGESVYGLTVEYGKEDSAIGTQITIDGKTKVSPLIKLKDLRITDQGVYLGNSALSLNIDQGVGLSIGHGLVYYGSKGFEVMNPLFLGINVMINSVSGYAKQELKKKPKSNKVWVYTKAFFKAIRPDNLVKNTGKMVLYSVKEGAKWVTNYWHKMFRRKEPKRGYNYNLNTTEGLNKFAKKLESINEDFIAGRIYNARYKAKKLLKTMNKWKLNDNLIRGILKFIIDYADNPKQVSNKAEKILEKAKKTKTDKGYLLAYGVFTPRTIYFYKAHEQKIREEVGDIIKDSIEYMRENMNKLNKMNEQEIKKEGGIYKVLIGDEKTAIINHYPVAYYYPQIGIKAGDKTYSLTDIWESYVIDKNQNNKKH